MFGDDVLRSSEDPKRSARAPSDTVRREAEPFLFFDDLRARRARAAGFLLLLPGHPTSKKRIGPFYSLFSSILPYHSLLSPNNPLK